MKKHLVSSILLTFLLTILCQTQASAWIFHVKWKNGEICLSGGSDSGHCGSRIFAGGDVDVLVNNKLVPGNDFKVTVDANGRTASFSAQSTGKSESKTAAPKVQKSVDLSKILIRNKQTGETLSLRSYLEILEGCRK